MNRLAVVILRNGLISIAFCLAIYLLIPQDGPRWQTQSPPATVANDVRAHDSDILKELEEPLVPRHVHKSSYTPDAAPEVTLALPKTDLAAPAEFDDSAAVAARHEAMPIRLPEPIREVPPEPIVPAKPLPPAVGDATAGAYPGPGNSEIDRVALEPPPPPLPEREPHRLARYEGPSASDIETAPRPAIQPVKADLATSGAFTLLGNLGQAGEPAPAARQTPSAASPPRHVAGQADPAVLAKMPAAQSSAKTGQARNTPVPKWTPVSCNDPARFWER